MQYFEDDYGYRHGFEEADELEHYLSPIDVMSLLHIGKNSFYRMVNSGELHAIRVGKLWRVPREALINLRNQSQKINGSK